MALDRSPILAASFGKLPIPSGQSGQFETIVANLTERQRIFKDRLGIFASSTPKESYGEGIQGVEARLRTTRKILQ